MPATVMAAGLVGCGGSGGTSTGVAAADTQAAEAQKEEVKDDAKGEDEKEDLETSDSEGASDFYIGIITGSVSQPEDGRCDTEAFQAMCGEDMVELVVHFDNFTEELKIIIQAIVSLSDGPKTRAIVMNQSVPGTTEVFRKIRETRSDIFRIASEGHEDLPGVGSTADLVYSNDFIARGYLIIHTVHEFGCSTLVHISFSRHMAYETMSRRVAIMKEAREEFGMELALGTAPDPTFNVGVAGAQVYILEKVPEWVEEYGGDATYLCTNNTHTEPLLKQPMKYGGYFTEADLPPPLIGCPGALGIDLTAEAGDFDKILVKVESIIAKRGGADQFGTQAYPYGYATSADLARRALNVLSGENEPDDIDSIARAYQVFSPKVEWNGSDYINAETDVRLDSVFLVYQDTHIMGGPEHPMGSTKIEVPEKYFTIE